MIVVRLETISLSEQQIQSNWTFWRIIDFFPVRVEQK